MFQQGDIGVLPPLGVFDPLGPLPFPCGQAGDVGLRPMQKERRSQNRSLGGGAGNRSRSVPSPSARLACASVEVKRQEFVRGAEANPSAQQNHAKM